MRIITRYILGELLKPFFFGLFAFCGIMLGGALVDLIEFAGRYQLSISVLLRLFIFRIPETVALGSPMAMLLATLIGLGNITGHSETIAMQAGGVSFNRIALPVLITGLVVSGVSILVNETIVPPANRLYNLEKAQARSVQPQGVLRQYFFTDQDKDGVKRLIYAEEYYPAQERLVKVVIQEMQNNEVKKAIFADEVLWAEDKEFWFFKEGVIYNYEGEKVVPLRLAQGNYPTGLTRTPREVRQLALDPEDMSWSELNWYIKNGSNLKNVDELRVMLHQKISIPFASFFFALLGLPLGLQPQRRTSSAGFGLSLLFIFIYYVLMGFGTYLGQSGLLSPFIAAWMQNFILGGYGFYHFMKAAN